MKSPRHIACAALLLAFVLLLASCGGDKTDPAEGLSGNGEAFGAPEESIDEEAVAATAAMEQYRIIINQADSYKYSEMPPAGAYRYALVMMQTQYNIPALFLEQESTVGIGYIRVFQYDPDSEMVHQPTDVLLEGTADAGGFRGSLSAAGDKNGVLASSFTSGTGMGSTERVTVDGDSLRMVTLWEGNFFTAIDWISDEIGNDEIEWHDITDTSALDNWTPDTDFVPTVQESETALPTDGDRIVFRGTIGLYSYEETILLQGCPDPNAEYSDPNQTFRLIVLDIPQKMTLLSGDGDGFFESEVSLVGVPYMVLPEEYDGRHLTFSMNPNDTFMPSDTSMPVGQPNTLDVYVLE